MLEFPKIALSMKGTKRVAFILWWAQSNHTGKAFTFNGFKGINRFRVALDGHTMEDVWLREHFQLIKPSKSVANGAYLVTPCKIQLMDCVIYLILLNNVRFCSVKREFNG